MGAATPVSQAPYQQRGLYWQRFWSTFQKRFQWQVGPREFSDVWDTSQGAVVVLSSPALALPYEILQTLQGPKLLLPYEILGTLRTNLNLPFEIIQTLNGPKLQLPFEVLGSLSGPKLALFYEILAKVSSPSLKLPYEIQSVSVPIFLPYLFGGGGPEYHPFRRAFHIPPELPHFPTSNRDERTRTTTRDHHHKKRRKSIQASLAESLQPFQLEGETLLEPSATMRRFLTDHREPNVPIRERSFVLPPRFRKPLATDWARLKGEDEFLIMLLET